MQWHQLDHTETISTSLQTDNHTKTLTLNFYRPGALPDAQSTVSKHWRHSKTSKRVKPLAAVCCWCRSNDSSFWRSIIVRWSRSRFSLWLLSSDYQHNNNSHDNLYGAVIVTEVIARVHPVHLMNADWAPGGRQPSDQASRLGLWVRRKLAAIIHIRHRHCYYYSARRLILISPSHEGWKAESTWINHGISHSRTSAELQQSVSSAELPIQLHNNTVGWQTLKSY